MRLYLPQWHSQSLGLDVKVLDKDNQEIDLKQNFDDDEDVGFRQVENEDPIFDERTVADNLDGYGVEDDEGNPLEEDSYTNDDYDEGFDDVDGDDSFL